MRRPSERGRVAKLHVENERERWLRTWTVGDTGLLTSWLFFPERSPYKSFDVMVAANDSLSQMTPVQPTSKFVIEDGSILGWQLVDARAEHLYELRWTVRQ